MICSWWVHFANRKHQPIWCALDNPRFTSWRINQFVRFIFSVSVSIDLMAHIRIEAQANIARCTLAHNRQWLSHQSGHAIHVSCSMAMLYAVIFPFDLVWLQEKKRIPAICSVSNAFNPPIIGSFQSCLLFGDFCALAFRYRYKGSTMVRSE